MGKFPKCAALFSMFRKKFLHPKLVNQTQKSVIKFHEPLPWNKAAENSFNYSRNSRAFSDLSIKIAFTNSVTHAQHVGPRTLFGRFDFDFSSSIHNAVLDDVFGG
jgi:hypothetical protein